MTIKEHSSSNGTNDEHNIPPNDNDNNSDLIDINDLKDVQELLSLPVFFTKEYFIILFLLENYGNKPYFTITDLIENTPLCRQQVDKGTDTLKKLGCLDKLRECPSCGKNYPYRIPPHCKRCRFSIFPDLSEVISRKKWPMYLIMLNEKQKQRCLYYINLIKKHFNRIT